MTDEQLAEKISKSASKIVVRKYPFIMSGDFEGIFTPEYTYRGNYLESKESKRTGVRTILWINPDIFFDLYDTNSFLYNTIMSGNMNFTSRYLSSLYNKNQISEKEVEKIDDNILKIFYETGHAIDTTNQLGFLDFFIRFAFMGSTYEWNGFIDSDIAVPPEGIK